VSVVAALAGPAFCSGVIDRAVLGLRVAFLSYASASLFSS
jgi:hypothetical protein